MDGLSVVARRLVAGSLVTGDEEVGGGPLAESLVTSDEEPRRRLVAPWRGRSSLLTRRTLPRNQC